MSILRQCQLLGISRASLYYQAKDPNPEELAMLRLLDEQYLKTPFYGSRKMMKMLR